MSRVRRKLKRYAERCLNLTAQVSYVDYSPLYRSTRFCIKDVTYGNTILCDHTWVSITDNHIRNTLHRGDKITFTAYVTTYRRSNGTTDYTLAAIRNIQIL